MEELTFSTVDRKIIPIENSYKDSSCFLVFGGPGLNNMKMSLLKQPGIISLGVNNSVKAFRPNLWTCVDDPEKFMYSIWKDPTIQKIVPFHKGGKRLFNNYLWQKTDEVVQNCPNVVYYHRNEHFQPEIYLSEKTVNWGNHKKFGGSRSVMLAAIKIAYLLGFRKVFLCGCTFKMENNTNNYAWKQNRTNSSVNGNNSTYRALTERFKILRPIFEQNDFYVFNCTPDSHLKVFPQIDLEDAVKMALNGFPDVQNENVEGMYERVKDEKDKK